MGTVRLGVFPSINNKIMQDKIAKQVAEWFINKFPSGFFNHFYLDTQNKNASQYVINSNGEFVKYESGQKIIQPNIKIIIEQGANNINDAFNGIYNVSMKPGAYAIETDLRGYKPIYEDCYGSILSVNDYPIRNNVRIQITLQTKADQLAVANILNSNFKAGTYGDIIICDSVIPLPNLLTEYLRSCFFKPEINILSKMSPKDIEYDSYRKKINKTFMEFIYRFSNGAIKPYKSSSEDDSEHNYVYGYERKQRVFVKLEEPELDTGTKKGNVYDHFNVELSGSIDYANLVSFITSVPAIIRGTKNDWKLRTSNNKNKNLYYSMMKFKEVYKENRFLEPISDKYIHFYLEREVLMSSVEESFDFLDTILVEKQFPAHYHVLKALLSLIKTQEDFDNLFKVCIYKDRYLITDYEIDKNFHINIHNCDLSVPYYIDVFLNKNVYNNYIEKMKEYLAEYEINWTESNVNTNRGYINNLLSGSYKGQIIRDHNSIQLDPNYLGRDISKIYTSTNSNRGSNWNINFDGTNLSSDENIYTPIKINLYYIPDPNYTYYFRNIESFNYDNPELTKDGKISNFIKGREYYYYNNYGDLEKVESQKLVLISVPKESTYGSLTLEEIEAGPINGIVYYRLNSSDKYVRVSSFPQEVIFDNSKTYYYKNDDGEIVPVEKTRVYDKRYVYYIYDQVSNDYLEDIGLTEFDDNTDYYIRADTESGFEKVEPIYVYDSNITYYLKDENSDSYIKVKPVNVFKDTNYYTKITKLNLDPNETYYIYNENGELVEIDKDKEYDLNTRFYIYKTVTPDSNTIYYHYETSYTKITYIPVDITNGFNINKDYYIKDDSNTYAKIDIEKMLVPNPNFKYYIKNTETGEFQEVKNITEFNSEVQYFTNIYDKDTGNIIIYVKENK